MAKSFVVAHLQVSLLVCSDESKASFPRTSQPIHPRPRAAAVPMLRCPAAPKATAAKLRKLQQLLGQRTRKAPFANPRKRKSDQNISAQAGPPFRSKSWIRAWRHSSSARHHHHQVLLSLFVFLLLLRPSTRPSPMQRNVPVFRISKLFGQMTAVGRPNSGPAARIHFALDRTLDWSSFIFCCYLSEI